MPKRIELDTPAIPEVGTPTLAASRLDAMDLCPGFVKDPLEGDKSAADEGAALHAMIERELDGVIRPEGEAPKDSEQDPIVRWCVELAYELAGTGFTMEPEVSVNIPFIGKPGWIDLLMISHDRRRAIIVDWKTGRNKQGHPSVNPQFRAYAVGVWMKYPGLESVQVVGAYPRLRSVEKADFTLADFKATLEKLAEISVKSADFGPRLNPNPNCGYCGRAALCPALNRLAADTITVLKSELPVGLDPEQVPPHRTDILAAMRDMAGVLEGWVKAVKTRSDYVAIKLNYSLPGYELQTRAGRRAFRDPSEALQLANLTLTELGAGVQVTPADVLKVCSPSPADVEKIIKGFAPPRKGASYAECFRAVCDQHAALTAGDDIVFLKRNPDVKIALA